eukprot:tig00001408_g8607.t1
MAVAGSVRVTFKTSYDTQFGQVLFVEGSIPQLAAKDGAPGAALTYAPWAKWRATMALPASALIEGFKYRYVLKSGDGSVEVEGGGYRTLKLAADVVKSLTAVELKDSWRKGSDPETIFMTSAFRDVIFGRAKKSAPAPSEPVAITAAGSKGRLWVRLQLYAPRVGPEDTVFVCGAPAALGGWDVKKAVPMSGEAFPLWSVDLLVAREDLPLSYKFVAARADRSEPAWEAGDNRILPLDALDLVEEAGAGAQGAKGLPASITLFHEENFRYEGAWRGAGVAVPVFSLRTGRSGGIGEFLDLKPLVDLCAKCSIQLIQLLPVNDTTVTGTWRDSYPYSSVSVIALHPGYVNLAAVGGMPAGLGREVEEEQKRLNALPAVDFEGVMKLKRRVLRELYLAHKSAFLASPEYRAFYAENADWLLPYAVFCFFRDLTDSADFSRWGKRAHMSRAEMEAFAAPGSPHFDAVTLHCFVQFHAHRQLLEATQYAVSKHVAVKGDLPIGVNKACADTWIARSLFRMNTQTGAPPDFFAVMGQNWGFPTYNWEEMGKDGYAWWRMRLRHMAKYFHAYRIDHILGFFRIWEIPDYCVTGLLGRFRPAIPIRKAELDKFGIWDINRLTEPYVRRHLVERIFPQPEAQRILDTYFEPCEPRPHAFRFRPQFDTERKIEAALRVPADAPEWQRTAAERTRNGLFELMDNVVLRRDDEEADAYHPRILMHNTSSYNELPSADWKRELYNLYVNYFYERQDGLWAGKAMEKLPMMKDASDMLVCGEDLGMVPECVAGVLERLAILGLRIQRMPAEDKVDFGDPAAYPYLTVCTPSCHDMSTVRGWWEEDRGKTQKFYNGMLGMQGGAPQACEPHIAKAIVEQHLRSPSVLAVFPIQDLVALRKELCWPNPRDEQINVPANAEHYWRWRLHLDVDELAANGAFTAETASIVAASGRGKPY